MIQLQQIVKEKPLDHPLWKTTDKKGNTILHLAAVTSKPQTVSWILGTGPKLVEVRNHQGETALDALGLDLERKRSLVDHGMMTLNVSDKFEGFDDDSVGCLAQLKGLTSVSHLDKLRLKYGCSCGECIAGMLSPRMRFALRNKAEYLYDTLSSSIEMESGNHFVEINQEELHYVLPHVRNNMRTNKSMRQGFANLFTNFATCLKKDNIQGLPVNENIIQALRDANEWPPCSRNYLERGGSIYAVGSHLFESSMNEDEVAGDGDPMVSFDEVFGIDNSQIDDFGLGAELASLPECRNDLEYGFVSALLGYKRVSRVPYIRD